MNTSSYIVVIIDWYPCQLKRSVNGSKRIKNGNLKETRQILYTDRGKRYRYGYVTASFRINVYAALYTFRYGASFSFRLCPIFLSAVFLNNLSNILLSICTDHAGIFFKRIERMKTTQKSLKKYGKNKTYRL